jgi:hypothetical protein
MWSARQDFWGSVQASKKLYSLTRNRDKDDDKRPSEDELEAAPMLEYQYTDLSDTKRCIRLLELQPGPRHSLIICQLNEIFLEASTHQYDALSYVWGSSNGDSISIQVNDARLDIGASLHCALEDLRDTALPRVLWADAICIDQSNDAERGDQVLLMREIYRNAACTVCYLGPKAKTTRIVYSMLEELAHDARTLEAPAKLEMDAVPTFFHHLPVRPAKTPLSEKYAGDSTIVAMAGSVWWHRAWTMQELVLSSNAVMTTGRYTMDWATFCTAVDHGLNLQIWGPVNFGFSMNPVVVPYLSLRTLIEQRRYHRVHGLGAPAVDLLHLLTNSRHRSSTDARDKVYSVLGLLRDRYPKALDPERADALKIELGYGYDVIYVYRRMCQELILKSENLDVLGICPGTTLPLPSWATDWSSTKAIGSPLTQDSLDRSRTTHATRHSKSNIRFSDDGACMVISGFGITTLVAVAEFLPVPILASRSSDVVLETAKREIAEFTPNFKGMVPDFDSMKAPTKQKFDVFKARCRISAALAWFLVKVFTSLFIFIIRACFYAIKLQLRVWDHDFGDLIHVFTTLFAWERFASAQPPTNPGSAPGSVYWQTLCAGTYKNESIDETEVLFEKWSELLRPLRKFTRRYPWIVRNFPLAAIMVYMKANWHGYAEFWPYIACSQRRCLGRAENGWLCLLPEEAAMGDIVVLAKGGRVPLVIRLGEEGYSFVGEAYIQGIMDGEAFEEERCADVAVY